jgi:hypothetical protein
MVIITLWAAFFWRILTPNLADRLTFQQGDFTLQFLAYRQMAFAQVSQGRIPVIEECIYAGHPFQADPQSQVLYPPVLASMLMGRALGWQTYPLRALEWEVMLHVLLAALGMYAFLKLPLPLRGRAGGRIGVTQLAALFAALAYAFGGFMTGYAMLQTAILETAAWLPLILLAIWWLAHARRWLPAAALLAVLVFCAFTAGHPQTLLFTVYAGVIAYVWWQKALSPRGMRLGEGAYRAVVAGTFAIGLCAIQLLPTLSFMLASTRASLTFEQAGRGFGLQDISLFALTGITNVWQPIYAGIVTLAFVGVAVANIKPGRSRETVLWLIIGIGALVLSFGANAFGFDLAYLAAPGYRQFQSQERHAVIVTFALAMLATYGLNAFLRPMRLRALVQVRRAVPWVLIGGAGAFGCVIAVIIASHIAQRNDLGTLTERLSVLTLGLIGTGALLAWRTRLSHTPRWVWGSAVLALLVFDLFSVNRFTAMQKPAEPFPNLPLLQPLQPLQPLQTSPTSNAGLTRVYNHFGLPLNGVCVRGLNEVGGGSPIALRDYKTFLERTPEDVMVKLLNVRYATTWRGAMDTPEGKTIPWFLLARDTFEGKEASTYRLDWEPQPATGTWIAKEVRLGEGDAVFDAMRSDGFDPFVTAFIAYQQPLPIIAGGSGSAAIEGKAQGYMKIAANADAPALLVVSQAYHWNWVALVNGVEVKPIVVNTALLGVPIPAGPSAIELSYRPTDLYVGAGITLLTTMMMIGLAIFR